MSVFNTCLQTIDCKQGAIRSVRFNVDGSYCLTCGADRKIKLWNPNKNLLLKTYAGHGNEVLDAAGSCDSSQLVSGGADKMVVLWDVSTGQAVRRYRGHASRVSCVKFNEESSVVVSGSHDNSVMLWDTRSRSYDAMQTLRESKDSVTSLQVTDHEILTSSVDGKIRIYDLRVGELTTDTIGEAVTSAAFTKDGQCVVTSCADATVRLTDKSTGELLNEFTGHTAGDYCVETATGPGDSTVLCGSADGCVWVWDLVSGSVLQKLVHAPAPLVVPTLSVHPAASQLLSAAAGSLKLWGEKMQEEEALAE